MIFKGELSKYHPADALMLLSQLGLNGVFSVSGDDRMLNLAFKDGFLLDAQSALGDENLLRDLRFQKKIDSNQYDHIRQIKSETDFHVRQIIGELALFPLSQVKGILTAGIHEVLLELFLLDNGTFVFTDMMVDEDDAGIRLDTGAVSLTILAQSDEVRDFEKSHITLDRRVRIDASQDIPGTVSTQEHAILKLANGSRTLRQLMEAVPYGSYSMMTVATKLLDQGLLTLEPVTDTKPIPSNALSFDPLFSSYKQALKMLVRADGILKKVEAIIAFCKNHYDGIFILTTKNNRFMHCKTIRMEKNRGISQHSIKKDLGSLDQEPVFQAVQRSGIGFFGNIFPSQVIRQLEPVREEWECALLPIVNRPDLSMFFFAYTAVRHQGLSPHHYLELLSWMIFQDKLPSSTRSTDVDVQAAAAGPITVTAETTGDSLNQGAAAIVARIEELPPLPSLASKGLSMLSDPEISLEDVEAVIARDQALVAKIIKVSNSALYGGLQQVVSLRQALARLGAKTTKSLILAASARGYFVRQHQGVQVYGRMLWQHAVECGIAARRIAATVNYEDPEQAFISGILHDIGKVAILMLHPEKYKQIQKLKNTEKLTDVQAEIKILQSDHTHIGQLLMAKWHMPEEVRLGIEFHHRPSEAGTHKQLSLIVAYGDFLSHAYGEHPQTTIDDDDPAIKELIEQLGLSTSDCQALTQAVQEDFQSTELMAE